MSYGLVSGEQSQFFSFSDFANLEKDWDISSHDYNVHFEFPEQTVAFTDEPYKELATDCGNLIVMIFYNDQNFQTRRLMFSP